MDHFGQYELEKMKSIYEAVIINKRVENSFIFGELDYPEYVDYLAKKEYSDLDRQIRELKYKLSHNKEEEERLEELIKKSELKDQLYFIIEKANPLLNTNSKAEEIWLDFLDLLKAGSLEELDGIYDRCKKIRSLKNKADNMEDLFLEEISYTEKKMEELDQYFPFNQEKIFRDEELIREKTRSIKEDMLSAQENVEKMYDVLLYTSQPTKWDN